MELGLQGKVAAVAASSRGLGFAVARELAAEGARISICSRDQDRIEEAASRIRQELADGGDEPQIFPLSVDLSKPGGAEAFVRGTEDHYGRVDILIANNGGPPPAPAAAIESEAWEAGFNQTFLSSVRMAQAVLAGMRERGWGRILFVTSMSVKQPIEGLTISTAMRSGVTGYAKSLADEVAADGVTVNSVAPGSTRTERLEALLNQRAAERGSTIKEVAAELERQIPAARFGRPDEFAAAVAFLASERASYITGVVLTVDGGAVRSLT